MPEPVFDSTDRVASTQLPEALRGVTDPVKIASYYQQRETQLREELRRAVPPPPNSRVVIERPVDNPPPPSATFSVAEAEAARATLIEAARQTARQGKPYWERLSDDIEKLMANCGPEDRVNSNIWSTCYHTLVGMNKDKLDSEDRTKAAEATRLAAERSSAPPDANAAPPPLPIEVTSKILPGLNLSEAQYRESQARIDKGVWPLTAENRGGQRVTIGSEK
jgi:hypothetical protein